MMTEETMTGEEAYKLALNETMHGYRGQDPSREEFLSTFESFYSEILAENNVIEAMEMDHALTRATIPFVEDL